MLQTSDLYWLTCLYYSGTFIMKLYKKQEFIEAPSWKNEKWYKFVSECELHPTWVKNDGGIWWKISREYWVGFFCWKAKTSIFIFSNSIIKFFATIQTGSMEFFGHRPIVLIFWLSKMVSKNSCSNEINHNYDRPRRRLVDEKAAQFW